MHLRICFLNEEQSYQGNGYKLVMTRYKGVKNEREAKAHSAQLLAPVIVAQLLS